jgi:hypothetical protein
VEKQPICRILCGFFQLGNHNRQERRVDFAFGVREGCKNRRQDGVLGVSKTVMGGSRVAGFESHRPLAMGIEAALDCNGSAEAGGATPVGTEQAVWQTQRKFATRAWRLSPESSCHNEIRSTRLSCSICNSRKEKRFCPAVHGRICPQCCGEQREVTLDCPSDCIYLQQAWEHDKPRSLDELDQSQLFPKVEVGQSFLYEQEHLILGLSYALAKSARGDRSIRDPDLIAALSALAGRYETLANSGLHYEAPVTNLTHQAITVEIQQMVKEYREAEEKHLGYSRLRDSDVLRALVFLLRMGYTRTSGRPRSQAFGEFLLQQFPEQASAIAVPQEASRIILP